MLVGHSFLAVRQRATPHSHYFCLLPFYFYLFTFAFVRRPAPLPHSPNLSENRLPTFRPPIPVASPPWTHPSPPPLPRLDDQSCLLYLIRHGATASNLANPPVLQGRGVDHALSPEGRLQAEQTAALMAPVRLSAIYSSTMRRAQQTAEVIAARHGLPVGTHAQLVEADVGDWEGMTWPEIAETHAEAHQKFLDDPENHGYTGGETIGQVQRRATETLEEIMRSHLGQQIAVVAHSVVNRSYLAGVLGLSLRSGRMITQENCGVNILRYRGAKTKLITLNAVFHLTG
ncbi:MAG: histidine phosphatase family protein [Pirellulaceae bacterium]